jgi:hypothetical protein
MGGDADALLGGGAGEGEGRRAGGREAEAVTATSLAPATYGTTRRLLSRSPRLSLSRNTTAHDPYLLLSPSPFLSLAYNQKIKILDLSISSLLSILSILSPYPCIK